MLKEEINSVKELVGYSKWRIDEQTNSFHQSYAKSEGTRFAMNVTQCLLQASNQRQMQISWGPWQHEPFYAIPHIYSPYAYVSNTEIYK